MQYNGNILKVNSTSNTYLQNINEKMTKVDRYSLINLSILQRINNGFFFLLFIKGFATIFVMQCVNQSYIFFGNIYPLLSFSHLYFVN